jgi:signal transduction histidine kinase
VSDNGIGTRQIVKGIGLAGMEERLASVGGTLEVFSPEDGGFRLKVIIPLMETLHSAGSTEQSQKPKPQEG